MKKSRLIILFTFSLLLANTICYSQKTDTAGNNKYVYCELVGIQKLFSLKITVSVDYGEELKWFKDTRIKDEETGKVQTFNTMVDALNYMGENGWEFVQAYTVTIGNQSVYHWLLKKKRL